MIPIRIFILIGVFAVGSASAPVEAIALPIFDGEMRFPAIHGPSDPEEYSWRVELGEEQALRLVNEQLAEVDYDDDHIAFEIPAGPAHDADGTAVPTSLAVSEGDVLTLTVHHREGNPAAGGAPFAYPVIAGAGWEGGFQTTIVDGPKDERELQEERERIAREEREAVQRAAERKASEGCLVPRLKGRSLRASRERLRKADCKIGKVRKLKGATAKAGKVIGQNPRPGTVLAPGMAVEVTLGE